MKLWAEIEQACDPDPENKNIDGFEDDDSPFVISHACSQSVANAKGPIASKLDIHAPCFSIGKQFADAGYTNSIMTAMYDFFDSRLQWKKASFLIRIFSCVVCCVPF